MSENGSQYIYQQQTDGSKSFEKRKKGKGSIREDKVVKALFAYFQQSQNICVRMKNYLETERFNIHFYFMKMKGKNTLSFDLKSKD